MGQSSVHPPCPDRHDTGMAPYRHGTGTEPAPPALLYAASAPDIVTWTRGAIVPGEGKSQEQKNGTCSTGLTDRSWQSARAGGWALLL